MKRTRILLCWLFVGGILFSCDRVTKRKQVVVNSSDYDIVLITDSTTIGSPSNRPVGYVDDTIVIKKHSELAIFNMPDYSKWKVYNKCNWDLFVLKTLIDQNPNKHLGLDLNNQSNWTFSVLKKDKMGYGECECRTVIKNEHIQ